MNLIFVIMDSLRKDHVGAYGNPWIRTPNLDQFAKDCVRFNLAYPESVPTLPFRNSTLTGRRVFPFKRWKPAFASYPYQERYACEGKNLNLPGWSPISREDTTMAELFNSYGYRTALVTDVFHQFYAGMNFHRGYQSWEWIRGQEWDLWKTDLLTGEVRDFSGHFTDKVDKNDAKVWEVKRNLINTAWRQYEEDYFSPQVYNKAIKWLETNYRCEKFFLCVDHFDPHEPWDPPQYYKDLYDPGYKGRDVMMPIYTNNASGYLSPAELKHLRACYAAEVTMVDHWFGMLMNKIKLLGMDKNSLIIVASDHGHQLGENNFTGKVPRGMLPCLLDLVLLIRHPEGTGAGKKINSFVYNHDLLPTICNVLGIEVPDWCEGEDVWPLVEGKKKKVRDYVTSIFKDYVWVRDQNFAMIARTDKSRTELYDLRKDPQYHHNIANKNPDRVKRMWDLLLKDADGDIPIINVSFSILNDEKLK
jgi:arylsulfatase A-like enzyme